MERPGQPRGHRRIGAIALVGLLGITLSAFLYSILDRREASFVSAEFARRADERLMAIDREWSTLEVVLESTAAFFNVHTTVSHEEFREFITPLLANHPAIQAIGFNQRVTTAQRATFEAEGAALDPGFRITECDADGRLVPAAQREEYVVVRFIEPIAGNESAHGFDIASEPARREALQRARDTGRPAATSRLRLVQERGSMFGVLICSPVYNSGDVPPSVERRREELAAYAVGVFRVGDVVRHAIAHLDPVDIDVHLYDESSPPGERLLHVVDARGLASPTTSRGDDPPDAAAPLVRRSTISMAGRQWCMYCTPSDEFLAGLTTRTPVVALLAGLATTSLLVAYLLRLSRLNDRLVLEVEMRREAESFLRLQKRAIDSTTNGVLITTRAEPDDPIIYVNPAFEHMTGYSREEIIGRNCRILQGDDRDQPGIDDLRDALAQGREARVVLRNYRKDGTEFWNELHIAPVRDVHDRITHFVGIVNDVTESLRAERALRESERRYRTLVETAPMCIHEVDLEGRIISMNPAGLAMIDARSVNDVAGSPYLNFVAGEDRARIAGLLDDALAGNSAEFEFISPTRVGPRIFASSLVPIHDGAGAVVKVMGITRDITERSHDLRRQRLMMRELDHRVKNNLAAVLSLAQQTVATAASLDDFSASFTGRLRALVRTHEALADARWEGGRVDQIVDLTIGPYRRLGEGRVVTEGGAILVPANATGPLTMALHELCTNAVKHGALSSLEGRVRITWSLAPDRVVTLTWDEDTPGPIPPPRSTGFGMRLIRGVIEHELGGRLEVDFRTTGLHCSLAFPLEGREAPQKPVAGARVTASGSPD